MHMHMHMCMCVCMYSLYSPSSLYATCGLHIPPLRRGCFCSAPAMNACRKHAMLEVVRSPPWVGPGQSFDWKPPKFLS